MPKNQTSESDLCPNPAAHALALVRCASCGERVSSNRPGATVSGGVVAWHATPHYLKALIADLMETANDPQNSAAERRAAHYEADAIARTMPAANAAHRAGATRGHAAHLHDGMAADA